MNRNLSLWLSILDAVLLGVFLHVLAGDFAAARVGMPGLMASDIIDELPALLDDWSV